MALIILDSAAISVAKAPNGGFALKLTDISGFPEGLSILIPFEGDYAEEVHEGIADALGKSSNVEVAIATPSSMASEVRRRGLHVTE